MSIFSSDLEEGLLRYGEVPGEEGLHSSGRFIRAFHIIKRLRQSHLITTFQSQDERLQLPTLDEENKIVRLALQSAKDNMNITGYKSIWKLCGDQIEGQIYDDKFCNSEILEEKLEQLLTNLEQEKLTRIASNMRPALEDLVQFYNQVGDHKSAVQLLTEYRRSWNRDTEMEIQYCKLLVVACLFAAASSESPDPLRVVSTISWQSPEAYLASGIFHLMKGDFEQALAAFQGMNAIPDGPITAIIHPKDAALYASLAAMAVLPNRLTMDHNRNKSLEVPRIVDYLPITRDILLSLQNCEYIPVIDFLIQAQTRLLLDPFLAPVLGSIIHAVKRRAVIEFCSAFGSVNFKTIADGTNIELNDVVHLLASGSQEDALNGRLDLIDQIFVKREMHPIDNTCNGALSLAVEHRNAVQNAVIQARICNGIPTNSSLLSQMALRETLNNRQ